MKMFYSSSWLCVYDDLKKYICGISLDILFEVVPVSSWMCAQDD